MIANAAGCAKYHYEPEPVSVEENIQDYEQRNLDDPGLREFMARYGDGSGEWPGKSWDLQALTLAGYYFNPQLQVAIARHDKSRVNEDIATLYPNPGIEFPLEYHSETDGGISPWFFGVVLDLIYEREAKRAARLEKARAGSEVTRVAILETAWQIYTSVREAMLNYYVAKSTREFLQRKHAVVEEIVSILSRSFELGQTSEFELNTMRLELQKVKLELVNQDVRISDALHQLAGEIGIPFDVISELDFNYAGFLHYLDTPQLDDSELQGVALKHRLDMQRELSEYAGFEAALKLEIEKQYPDITLSPGFVFDQSDNVWMLAASWIVPMLHPHNEGPIKLALADRKIKQAEVTMLQSDIINQVRTADARLEAVNVALEEARQLMQEARKRNRQIQKQFDLGQIDNLVLLRNELEVLTIEGALVDIELDVFNAAFNYEDVIQYPLLDIPAYQLQENQ